MVNISNIPAFIIRGAYTPPNLPETPVNFSQFLNRTVDVSNYPAEAFKYNFSDFDNNNVLRDSDLAAGDTSGTGFDRVIYADATGTTVTNYVHSLAIGNIKITYKDNTFYDAPPDSIRFFALSNGDLIISPRDTVRNDSGLLPQSQWKTVTIVSPINGLLQETTISAQDDPFPVCFTRGTLIETANGLVPVENLQKGDLILTQDNDLQPIRWIGIQHISTQALTKNLKLRPIRIQAGALGHLSPNMDLMVSPQHRILIRSEFAQKMFATDEVLIAAKHLLEIDGIDVAHNVTEVDYFHFMFDNHQIVFANGAASESLYGGAQTLISVGAKARQEIFTLFPELREVDPDNTPAKARVFVSGRAAREMVNQMGFAQQSA